MPALKKTVYRGRVVYLGRVTESGKSLRSVAMERADLSLDGIEGPLVIEGIPDFTRIPPASRLQFDSGATITVDMENRPCVLPGREIEADHPGHGKAFKRVAEGRRGARPGSNGPGR